MEYFKSVKDSGVTRPSHVAIVGDRLLTDVMMANMMGSYAFWIKDGVAESGKPPNFVRSSAIMRRYITDKSRLHALKLG
jgi:phosphatidylglycerophosphatase GEP4